MAEEKKYSKGEAIKKVYYGLGFAFLFVLVIAVQLFSSTSLIGGLNINWTRVITIGVCLLLLINKKTRSLAIWGFIIYLAYSSGFILRLINAIPWDKIVMVGFIYFAFILLFPKKKGKKK